MFVMLLISFHISLKIVIWLTRLLQFIRMLSGCLSCLVSLWIWIAHLSPIYMLGLHAVKLPPSHGFMPSWDLSDLLLFLQSLKFYPLETWSFLRLSQNTLALILLASGSRHATPEILQTSWNLLKILQILQTPATSCKLLQNLLHFLWLQEARWMLRSPFLFHKSYLIDVMKQTGQEIVRLGW